jgi:hypothetical protein
MNVSLRVLLVPALLLSVASGAGGGSGGAAHAVTIYVAPDASDGGLGRDNNPGTQASPASLDVVSQGKYRPVASGPLQNIPAGSEVILLPGTYGATPSSLGWHFWDMRLAGSAGAQTVFRSQVGPNGEHARINGGFRVMGGYVTYKDLEILDTEFRDGARNATTATAGGNRLGALININVDNSTNPTLFPGLKFINLDLHDGVQGIGLWRSAPDAVLYGSLIHDNGYQDTDRGHGHGIYTQNPNSPGMTKVIADNFLFRGFAHNLHAYSESSGPVSNYLVDGNFSFNASTRSNNSQDPNFLMGTTLGADNITFSNNASYHKTSGGVESSEFGFVVAGNNGTLNFNRNYLVGQDGVELNDWTTVNASGNTIVSGARDLEVTNSPNNFTGRTWTFTNNTYVSPTGQYFAGVAGSIPQSGATTTNVQPTQNTVFIQPNDYQPGRGNVAVFNWQALQSMGVNLFTVIGIGAEFKIWNVEDGVYQDTFTGAYKTPLVSGTYQGGLINLPLTITGDTPRFDAFLVVASFGPTFVRGDLNLDGQRSNLDIQSLLVALVDTEGYKAANYLSDSQMLAIGDVDQNGQFGNTDIQALLDLLTSGGGGMTTAEISMQVFGDAAFLDELVASVPEPATLAGVAGMGAVLLGRRRQRG